RERHVPAPRACSSLLTSSLSVPLLRWEQAPDALTRSHVAPEPPARRAAGHRPRSQLAAPHGPCRHWLMCDRFDDAPPRLLPLAYHEGAARVYRRTLLHKVSVHSAARGRNRSATTIAPWAR